MSTALAQPRKLTIEKKLEVFHWAAAQATSREIASRLNLSFDVFLAMIRDDPELGAALEMGQDFGRSEVKLALYEKARSGNVPAMGKFLEYIAKVWELQLQQEGRQARMPLVIDGVARAAPLLIDAESHDRRFEQQRAFVNESLDEIDPVTGEVCDLPGPSREKRKAGLA